MAGLVWIIAAETENFPGGYKDWQEPYGDRRQEFVSIGQDLPKAAMLLALHEALLTDVEMELGVTGWKTQFDDPFPSWSAQPGGDL
jgi:hypothetical protein